MAVIKRLEERFKEDSVNTEVVYNHPNGRVIRFYIPKEKEVKPHRSKSSVFITVLKGALVFYMGKEDAYETLKVGDSVYYEPDELHGFKALEDSVVEAIISPDPSSQRLSL